MTDASPRRTAPPRRGETWDERYRRIQAQFPSCRPDFSWYDSLESPQLLGRLLHDLANIGWERPTRRGQRSRLDPDEGMERIAALFEGGPKLSALEAEVSGDATTLPFHEAFAELAAERQLTITAISRLGAITMSRTEVHRLIRGERAPTGYDMEQVAAAFDKEPTYFHEYRVGMLTEAFLSHLHADPEISVHVVRQLEHGNGS